MNIFGRMVMLSAVMVVGAGFMVVGSFADQVDHRLDGTWVGDIGGGVMEGRFKNGTYETFFDGGALDKGTYATDNGTITMVITQLFGSTVNDFFAKSGLRGVALESKWYSVAEFVAKLKPMLLKSGIIEKKVDELISIFVKTSTDTYTVDDKNLVIVSEKGSVSMYTRK